MYRRLCLRGVILDRDPGPGDRPGERVWADSIREGMWTLQLGPLGTPLFHSHILESGEVRRRKLEMRDKACWGWKELNERKQLTMGVCRAPGGTQKCGDPLRP